MCDLQIIFVFPYVKDFFYFTIEHKSPSVSHVENEGQTGNTGTCI